MITKVGGIRVGHATDNAGLTGCTVVICDIPMVAGVDVRGANAGTVNTDLIGPLSSMPIINGLGIVGGSNLGIEAISGMTRYMEENKIGLDVKVTRLPIVSAAVIFDLAIGSPVARPTLKDGYQACKSATSGNFYRGSVGAGTGATVGKFHGIKRSTKGGLGTSYIEFSNGVSIGALVVVNSFGDVINPSEGKIIAGSRFPNKPGFANTLDQIKKGLHSKSVFQNSNTTIGIVATNAKITKTEANQIARVSHNGLARTISPVHTNVDGDTIFVIGRKSGNIKADVDSLSAVAADAVALAVLDAIDCADGLGGIPSAKDLLKTSR